jgi:hypothetical protein
MKKLMSLGLLLTLCSPALAGVRYTLHVATDDAGKHSEFTQNAWLQESKARFSFDEGVTTQNEIEADRFGAVAYSLDPVSHREVQVFPRKASSRPTVAIENIVTTKMRQEPGPVIQGHPTTHYTFLSMFDYVENGFILPGRMTHDVWVANDIADLDVMSWMMFQYRLRQDRGIESLFRQVSTLGRGLPLAYDGLARIQTGDGNMRLVRIGATVESVEKVNVDPSVFSAAANTFEVVAGGQ